MLLWVASIEGKPPAKVKQDRPQPQVKKTCKKPRNSPIFGGFFFDSGRVRGYYARPMSDRLPVQIDPIRLAQQGRRFEGHIPLNKLTRLTAMLLSDVGEIGVKLDFHKDGRGHHCLNGNLRADLQLECQRCLEAMAYAVDVELELLLVESEAEAERLGEEQEIFIVESTPILLTDIIEDELMLSLPQVAMHDEADCKIAIQHQNDTGFEEPELTDTDKPNPFAVLSELKRKDD